MNSRQRIAYIKESEKMIEPEKVAAVNRGSAIIRRLPMGLQKRIAAGGAKNNSYMGFVVEPYAFFLSYEIRDLSAARELLPPDYEIVPSAMFDGTSPKPSIIIGAFNVHTSVFWGSRVETYLIARNTRTGLMSWLIVDYQTNTNSYSYDPGQGFTGPNASRTVVTTSFKGEVIVDVENAGDHRKLALTADLENGRMRTLNRDLWVEGNLSVDYGGSLAGKDGDPFGLIFDPGEMARALEIPLFSISIEENSLAKNLAASRPFESACFPFAQHFITTSMPEASHITDEWGLEEAAAGFIRNDMESEDRDPVILPGVAL